MASRRPEHAALYVEAWPAGWRRLAPCYETVALTADEARALLTRTLAARRAAHVVARAGGWPTPPERAVVRGPSLGALARRLDPFVRACDHVAGAAGGAFVRLGSRSPKDAPWAAAGPPDALRVHDGEGAVALLASGSARVAIDLRAAIAAEYTPHVVVRPWRVVPPWAELRCFVRDGELVGVSSLRGADAGWPADVSVHAVRDAVEVCMHAFVRASPVTNVVTEVVVEADASGPVHAWLLDVNPFGPETDAGHFSWSHGGDFDGSFRSGAGV